MKQVIFTLCSARSGTLYLRNLFRRNVLGCCCRHEPFFDRGNPTMLGPAIYAAYAGRLDRLRALLDKKRKYIERQAGDPYLESNHAFLKSSYRVAMEFFPQMRLIHLVRDPLKVAKSEAYRETWRRRLHAPFHYYRGDDGGRYFFWALTHKEPIFRTFDLARLTLFQRYLIQWIEIENRAWRFLNEHSLHGRTFVLQAPDDLNDRDRLGALFQFLNLKTVHPNLVPGGRKNRSLGKKTVITDEDERQAREVFERIPAPALEIFRQEPYVSAKWSPRARSLFRLERPAADTQPEPLCAGSARRIQSPAI